jgi:hypothetical protein
MAGTTSMSGGGATVPRKSVDAQSEVTGWVGWIIFAGTMMTLVGTFHVIQGLVALFDDTYYLVGQNGLVVAVDYTAWGWTHLITGVVIFGAGLALFSGKMWARTVGVVLATVSAILNFAFIAAFPVWSLTIIALDVFVIYALTAHGGEMKKLAKDTY